MMEIVLAVAGLAGFVFEWRRQARAVADEREHERRIAELEEQVAELRAWRDRTARAL